MSKRLNEKIFDAMLEEGFRRYAAEIETQDIVSDLTDEEIDSRSEQKERVYKNVMDQISREKRRKRFSPKKVIAIAAAITISTVVLMFNALAFKVFIFRTYVDIRDTVLNVNTQNETLTPFTKTLESFDKSQLVVPGWLPKNSMLDEIVDHDTKIIINYSIGDKYLHFTEEILLAENTDFNIAIENNEHTVWEKKIMGYDGVVVKVTSETDLTVFSATWNTDSMRYTIDTDVSEIMFESILMELKFYNQ